MDIQHKTGKHHNTFYIERDGKTLAELVYAAGNDQQMVIEHTEVDDELRGQNIGFELVRKAVEYARANNLKILPMCPFAKAVIDKRTEFQDVLARS